MCCFTISTSLAQSFNCHQATKADEIAICRSGKLSSLDEQLSVLFFKLRNSLTVPQQRSFTSEQQSWLAKRAACGSDAGCIESVYELRLSELGFSPPSTSRQQANTFDPADVLAMVKYDGTKAATLQYGDLVIKVDSEASKSEPTSSIPFVTAQSKSGLQRFEIHLEGDEDVGQEQPAAQVRLIKLDPSSSQPQVVFTYYWNGAHCCTITKIGTADAEGSWYIVNGGILNGDGYQFLELDGNGASELISADNSFLYAFGCYACSYAPTRIEKLIGHELKDVTADRKYQEFLRDRLRQLETGARTYGDANAPRTPGYLGGWVAAKALIGELSDAWKTMLASYQPDPNWTMEECVRPVPMHQCADADRREVQFPEALAFHLIVQGYITPNEKQRLASIAEMHRKTTRTGTTNTTQTPLELCTAAIQDPLKSMIIDGLIAEDKHIAPDWTSTFKSEIESEYGSFVTIRDDATVERVELAHRKNRLRGNLPRRSAGASSKSFAGGSERQGSNITSSNCTGRQSDKPATTIHGSEDFGRFFNGLVWATTVVQHTGYMSPVPSQSGIFCTPDLQKGCIMWLTKLDNAVRLTFLSFLILLPMLSAGAAEPMMTEQQARLKAAQWVRGPMFGAEVSVRGPAADKSLTEVINHIREAVLAVRGDTRYCGLIREPTWILMWDSVEAAEWHGGYPVMINARTGKVIDCRS